MKRLALVLAVLFMAAPAMAANVAITVTDLGGCQASIDYTSDVNVSAFGLDITVDRGKIVDINDFFVGECGPSAKGFGIFPASFAACIDPQDPNWYHANYTPVAPNSDPGAQDGLGSSAITIEMGALYESGNAPGLSGRLCKIQVTEDCNVTVTVNSTRCGKTAGMLDAGVVLEDGTAVVPTLTGATNIAKDYWPCCWDYLTQCHGDVDDDTDVDISDWPSFKDGFGKSYPNQDYIDNVCADYDKNGTIDIVDWPNFKDAFVAGVPVASDCTPLGDPCSVF